MNYTYRKGRIVTIAWSHGGEICKVLARAGQIVYDTIKNDTRILKEEEYIVYNELWIKGSDFLVPNTDTPPTLGFLVHGQHLRASTEYEKILRRKGISISPLINSEEPELLLGEILLTKKDNNIIHPIMWIIHSISSGLVNIKHKQNTLTFTKEYVKHNFRKTTEYEEKTFKRSEKRFHTKKVLANHI